MGINLCGGDIGVAQKLLELPEVHLAAMQQMGRYAVAQYVGCELRSYIGLFGVPL